MDRVLQQNFHEFYQLIDNLILGGGGKIRPLMNLEYGFLKGKKFQSTCSSNGIKVMKWKSIQ